MRKRVRLRESDLHRIVKESVKRVLRESEFDDFDYDEKAYDIKGCEIHKGDIVIWTDPETRRKVKYEVYEEPSSEMVKMANKYGECEALPEECLVIS